MPVLAWDYAVVKFFNAKCIDVVCTNNNEFMNLDLLNKETLGVLELMGKCGWEMVSVIPCKIRMNDEDLAYFFKRLQ